MGKSPAVAAAGAAVVIIGTNLVLTGCTQEEEPRPADSDADAAARFEQSLRHLTGGLTTESHHAAVEVVRTKVPVVQQFHELYPEARGFITHFAANDRRVTTSNSITTLYDRYELTLQLPITLTENRREVSFQGEPKFSLVEFTVVEDLGGGRVSLHSGSDWEFGAKTWEEIRRAEGRIENVLEGIHTDRPVKGFERYKHHLQQRKGRPGLQE